ncbi:MAG: beta/alpha barrel domain-containing protein [Chloroflexota bacterium]
MGEILENARSTTGTQTRTKDVSPQSGMCAICVHDCPVLCEIGKAAFRGREVLYPIPEQYGVSTTASNKDYHLDWSHFQIQVRLQGAYGIEADSNLALFPNASVETVSGGVPLKVPVVIAGLGSTEVARRNWDGLAIGSALAGVSMTIGENVCGMDPGSRFENGKVVHSPDLAYRVATYRKYWDGVHGDIIVQTNVEDQRFGVELYAIKELGVKTIERKWGQGAKAIGGEVRIDTLERALHLKSLGYVLMPDPEDPTVQEAFEHGAFHTFERHSRVGMPELDAFVEDIAWLRAQGAERVFLKTGAYHAADVAFTLKAASAARIDQVTFDGAGGGTGMSPVPMMNECSTPTVYLAAQVLEGIRILHRQGRYVPDMVFAGGFVNEGQMYKAMAMSNLGDGKGPRFKAIGMARSPLTAAMKADYFATLAEQGKLPASFSKTYGDKPEQFFIAEAELRHQYDGHIGTDIPWAAVGLYTYFTDRIGVGLKQLLAGSRKFRLDLLDRSDIVSLSERAAKVTGIPTVEDAGLAAIHSVLDE